MAQTRANSATQGRVLRPRTQGEQPQGIQKQRARQTGPRFRQSPKRREQPDTPPPSLAKNTTTPGNRGTKRRIDQVPIEAPEASPQKKRSRQSPSLGEVPSAPFVEPVGFWVTNRMWPPEFLNPEMNHLFARPKPPSSRKRSNSATSTTPSDKPREQKSAPYTDARYEFLLKLKGTYMDRSDLGLTDESNALIQTLLNNNQTIPSMTVFDDDIFDDAYRNLQGRNEARVLHDVFPLIAPSAETHALRSKALRYVIESMDEGWNNSMPLTAPRPQPDYSVGFKMEAFSEEQLAKLAPFVGDLISGDQSLFMATYCMYFPFFTCEVKCGAGALDVADRQNAHSMTLAVRAVTELFRAVKREAEVHRQILAFSISHDNKSVRIYGHYPVIRAGSIKYYRHPIRSLDFQDGKEKWTAYRFTKNVYDLWVPLHFKRLCSAIDQLPILDLENASLSGGLSQGLEKSQLDVDSISPPEDEEQRATPDTSFTDRQTKKTRGRK